MNDGPADFPTQLVKQIPFGIFLGGKNAPMLGQGDAAPMKWGTKWVFARP
jgi:hypothetical protein